MYFNKPFWPRLCVFNSKESLLHNEARKAYLDVHKRIFKMAVIMKVLYGFPHINAHGSYDCGKSIGNVLNQCCVWYNSRKNETYRLYVDKNKAAEIIELSNSIVSLQKI